MEKPRVDFSKTSLASTNSQQFRIGSRQKLELDAIGSVQFSNKQGGEGRGRLVIHPHSYFKHYWDTVVTLTIVFMCFQTPVRVCFTPMSDMVHEGISRFGGVDALEAMTIGLLLWVELIFVLDILVYFHVGYSKLGVIVCDPNLIRSHYLWGAFVWDLLAAIPILFYPVTVWDFASCRHMTGSTDQCMPMWLYKLSFFITLLQLLKLPSGVRRSVPIRESISNAVNTTFCDMCTLLMLFMILTNFFTCAWFVTMAYNPETNGFNEWAATQDAPQTEGNNWLTVQADAGDESVRGAINCWVYTDDKCDLKDKWVLYINCFYWASNAGDGFDTVQTLEKVMAIIVTIVFNNGFFAFILASIIAAVQDFSRPNKKRATYRQKIDAVNEFLRENNVNETLSTEIREYFMNVWLPQCMNFSENTLCSEMPDYIRRKVMRDITIDVIVSSKFFSKYFSDFRGKPQWEHIQLWIERVSENVSPKYYTPNQGIVEQGESGTELFILKKGKVSVLIDIAGKRKQVATLGPGAYFGDLSLLGLTSSRSASIMTLSNVTVYLLTKEKFDEILETLPDRGHWLRGVMLDVASNYKR